MDDGDDADFNRPVDLPGHETPVRGPAFRPKRPFMEVARGPFLIFITLLAVVGIGYGIWQLIPYKKQNQAQISQPKPTAGITSAPSSDIGAASNSQTYKSDKLEIEFKHPKAWTVSEKDDGLRVTSPDFTYKTIDNGQQTGNFRVYIRKGARDIDGTFIGKGVAIKPSEKLVYKNPSLGQRPDTLVSLFGNGTPNNFAFFLIAGNFQLKPGDTLGPTYGREPDAFIIGGGFSGPDLTDDLATNSVPTDSLDTSNAYKQAIEIIKSLKV